MRPREPRARPVRPPHCPRSRPHPRGSPRRSARRPDEPATNRSAAISSGASPPEPRSNAESAAAAFRLAEAPSASAHREIEPESTVSPGDTCRGSIPRQRGSCTSDSPRARVHRPESPTGGDPDPLAAPNFLGRDSLLSTRTLDAGLRTLSLDGGTHRLGRLLPCPSVQILAENHEDQNHRAGVVVEAPAPPKRLRGGRADRREGPEPDQHFSTSRSVGAPDTPLGAWGRPAGDDGGGEARAFPKQCGERRGRACPANRKREGSETS